MRHSVGQENCSTDASCGFLAAVRKMNTNGMTNTITKSTMASGVSQ